MSTIDTFSDAVVKKKFSLLSLFWYLFSVMDGNKYLPPGSTGITTTDNMPDR